MNFRDSDFTGVFCDGGLGFWETDVTYLNVNGEETSLNGNYFCATPNGKGVYSFDEDSVWYVWSDSYVGSLTLADSSCVESYDGTEKTVTVCSSLTIGDEQYAEGDTVTINNVTFIVDSGVFGQEPAPWTGDYTISVSVVADDEAALDLVTVTAPTSAVYGEEFGIEVQVPDGCGVAYVSACGKIRGADESVTCTASFPASCGGALEIEGAVAPVEGSDVWIYEENDDGTVTIVGSAKYSDSEDYLCCIVPSELDGKAVTGFGNGADTVIYRSGLYSITFREGIENFAYQALYDLNGCVYGILPGSAAEIDDGFARSMPAVTWGIQAVSGAAREFVENVQYSSEFVNVWEEANQAAAEGSSSGEAGSSSGEASGPM